MNAYIIPVIFIATIVFACVKKVNCYESFTEGAKDGFKLTWKIFPYLCSIFVMLALLEKSGLQKIICNAISPLFAPLGIPAELCELIFLKPLSGNGSLATVENVIAKYGADSRIARSACVIMGSSETVFYVSSVYFSNCGRKKLGFAIPASLIASFIAAVFSCFICNLL